MRHSDIASKQGMNRHRRLPVNAPGNVWDQKGSIQDMLQRPPGFCIGQLPDADIAQG